MHKMIFAITLALGTSVAMADKVSDFKDAKKAADDKKGCETIPYGDLQSTCKTQGAYVHDWCDGKEGPITCGNESITPQLMTNVVNEFKNVDALKEKKRNLEDKKSRAVNDDDKNQIGKEIDQVDREIYEAGKSVDQAKAHIDARKKHVEAAMYTIEKCIDYRRAVLNVFGAALDKVRTESEDDIKPLARELLARYQDEKGGHEEAIQGKKNALETCKNARP